MLTIPGNSLTPSRLVASFLMGRQFYLTAIHAMFFENLTARTNRALFWAFILAFAKDIWKNLSWTAWWVKYQLYFNADTALWWYFFTLEHNVTVVVVAPTSSTLYIRFCHGSRIPPKSRTHTQIRQNSFFLPLVTADIQNGAAHQHLSLLGLSMHDQERKKCPTGTSEQANTTYPIMQ